MRKRAVAIACTVVALAAVVVAVRCRHGSPSKATGTATGQSSATVRARSDKLDPRKAPRVAIAGVITSKPSGPIAGATVCIMGEIEHVPKEETRDPRCAPTDANGRYEFDQLYAGKYSVTATAPHHVPDEWRGPPPDRESRLALAAGEHRDDIDIALSTGGVEVRGTVGDINGGPIADAWVFVDVGGLWGYERPTATARSATDGTFTTWTNAGTIEAMARADGYASGWTRSTAPTQHLEILLSPESVLIGTVVDAETGAPVAGATVAIGSNVGGDGAGGRGTTTADDQGRFRFTRLPPGRYKPSAEAIGRYGMSVESVLLGLGQTVENVEIRVHPMRVLMGRIVVDDGSGKLIGCNRGSLFLDDEHGRDVRAESNADGWIRIDAIGSGTYKPRVYCRHHDSESEYDDIAIAAADVTDLEWTVHPHATGTIVGTVRTKAGAPVKQARVSTYAGGGPTTWTDDDGVFSMLGVKAGEYELEVSARGQLPPAEPVKVTVAAGTEARVEIVFDDGGRITGTVVDERGRPVAGASVQTYGPGWNQDFFDERTGDDGGFDIGGLKPGEYHVMATLGLDETMRKPGTTDIDRQGERVTVSAGQTRSVRLVVESRSATISGVVVDQGGKPVPDGYVTTQRESEAARDGADSAVQVTRRSWAARQPVATDAGGAFILTELSPGKYTVRAYRRGGGEAIAEHVVAGTASARLVLKPTGSIAGTVMIKGAGTAEQFTVTLADQATGFTRRESFFRTSGRFSFAELPGGTYMVRGEAADGQVDTTTRLGEGERKVGLVLTLDARVGIKGRLIALDDATPLADVSVVVQAENEETWRDLMQEDDAPGKRTTSGTDGRFVIKEVPAGSIEIAAYPRDDSPFARVELRRVTGGAVEIDVGDIKLPRRPSGGYAYFGAYIGFAFDATTAAVTTVDADGPAARSGLVVGDVITSVDGIDVRGDDIYLVSSLLRVDPGTKLALGLGRGATVSIIAVRRR